MTVTTHLRKDLATVAKGFDELRSVAVRLELEDQSNRLFQRSADLQQPLLVMVVGDGNFGKSSLVNALLGVKVAKVGIIPTTTTVDLYSNRTPEGAELLWEGGEEPERTSIDKARRIVDDAKMAERAPLQVRWNVDADWPARPDVALVDTPGISQFRAGDTRQYTKLFRSEGLELERRDPFEQFYFRADAVVWCIRSDEVEAKSVSQSLAAIESQDKVTLGVITCIDRVPQNRRQEVIDRAQTLHGAHFSKFSTVSTKDDGSLNESETVAHLRCRLDTEVIDLADALKREAAFRALATEGEELAGAINILATGLHDGLKRRRQFLTEAERGKDRALHGVRARARDILERHRREADDRATEIAAQALSSAAARSALASRAVDVPAVRAGLAEILGDVGNAGSNLVEERRQHIAWEEVVVGQPRQTRASARQTAPSAPKVSVAQPVFAGVGDHSILDFALQFDFLKSFAQNALLKHAKAAIASTFKEMGGQVQSAIKKYESSLGATLANQVDGSFNAHFGASAAAVGAQVLALLAAAHTVIAVLEEVEPGNLPVHEREQRSQAVAQAKAAAVAADAAFAFVVGDLIDATRPTRAREGVDEAAWLDDLVRATASGSPAAADNVIQLLVHGSDTSATTLIRLLAALPSPRERARQFTRASSRFGDGACTALLKADPSPDLVNVVEDELIKRARANSAVASRLQGHDNKRVRSAARGKLLDRYRIQAHQQQRALDATRPVEIVTDLLAWQHARDRVVAELDRWTSSLPTDAKQGLKAELAVLSERRAHLTQAGTADAARSNAAYQLAVEAANQALTNAQTLYVVSFVGWAASVFLLVIPGLAFLVWFGSFVLWLVMRPRRQALQAPDAWRAFLDTNRRVPATPTVTPGNVATAGWFADPSGQARWRYWDGCRWTEHTSA